MGLAAAGEPQALGREKSDGEMQMPEESRIVPCLSMKIANFNPNHRYRFLVWSPPEQRWLAGLAFAKGDDSIYLAPHLQRQYTLTGHDSRGSDFAIAVEPYQDLHVSFHESGAVNLTAAGRRIELRGKQPTGPHCRSGGRALRTYILGFAITIR